VRFVTNASLTSSAVRKNSCNSWSK